MHHAVTGETPLDTLLLTMHCMVLLHGLPTKYLMLPVSQLLGVLLPDATYKLPMY